MQYMICANILNDVFFCFFFSQFLVSENLFYILQGKNKYNKYMPNKWLFILCGGHPSVHTTLCFTKNLKQLELCTHKSYNGYKTGYLLLSIPFLLIFIAILSHFFTTWNLKQSSLYLAMQGSSMYLIPSFIRTKSLWQFKMNVDTFFTFYSFVGTWQSFALYMAWFTQT